MLPLIFSTEEGRRKDVMAKIAAALTFTISIFLWFAVINLALCQVVYGLNGFNNIAGLVLSESIRHQSVMFSKYLAVLLMLALEALLSLCAITLCICPSEQFIWSRHHLCSMLGTAGDNKNIFRRLYGPYRRCHASIPDYDKHGQRHL